MSKYSYEEKLAAIELVTKEGLSVRDAAQISEISRASLQRWLARYEHFGPDVLLIKQGSYDGAF